MSTIEADGGPLPPIPDDLSVADFVLNRQHPLRPSPNCLHPLLIEESTGRQIGSDEVSGMARLSAPEHIR